MSKKNISTEQMEKALDEIRPHLQADGGDVRIVNWDDESGVLSVELLGMCHGCPMAQVTLKQGIEATIKKAVPEVKEVRAI